MMRQHRTSSVRKAFTLIEMLVVLLIIGILAAILFPVLKSARESGYQAACATNLHQIYLAVELYRKDEGGYPGSLAALLPDTADLANYSTGDPELNAKGQGYFKGGVDALVGSDDDTLPLAGTTDPSKTLPRSSYSDISVDTAAGPQDDFGRFVWNYWGYRAKADTGTCSATDVSGCMGTDYKTTELSAYQSTFLAAGYVTAFSDIAIDPTVNRYWIEPSKPYQPDSTLADYNPIDVTKLPRLVNRFAPPNTIITHCVYHRLPTSNVVGAYDIYNADGSGQGAKDIVLRLDGTAKVLDVTTGSFVNKEAWALQNF